MVGTYDGWLVLFSVIVAITASCVALKLVSRVTELARAQLRTEAVLNSISDVYVLFDRHWRFLYVNEAAVRGIRRPREQILGRTLWELYPDIVGTEMERQYRRAMEERVPVVYDFHYPALDTWWHNRFHPVSEGLVVFATDITERKVAEDALRRSEEQFLSIFRESPIAISIGTVDEGRLIDVNDRYLEFTGYLRREVIGRTALELGLWMDSELRLKLMEKLKAGEPVHNVEAQFRRKSGEIATALFSREILQLRDGRVGFAMWVDITERKAAEAKLAEYAGQLQALSRRLADLQEAERRQLSRELHDRIGQYLTALNINLDIARTRLSSASTDGAASRIEDSARLVEATMQAVDDLMSGLRPPMLDDLGFLEAIRWHASEFGKRTGIATAVTAGGAAAGMSRAVELALFRIAQEALTNIAKHAHARAVRIAVHVAGESVRLDIIDDGVGFDPAAALGATDPPHWGLLSMRERAQAVGGVLQVDAAPGRGTRITVEVQRLA